MPCKMFIERIVHFSKRSFKFSALIIYKYNISLQLLPLDNNNAIDHLVVKQRYLNNCLAYIYIIVRNISKTELPTLKYSSL